MKVEIDRYLFVSPFSKLFKTNWIELKANDSKEGILISKAMTGFNLNFKEKTEEIYNALYALKT